MAQARLWLWGLIPLAIFWALTIRFLTPHVEHDLETRSMTALAQLPWTPSSLTVHGRDLYIKGKVATRDQRATALETAEKVEGVRRVHEKISIVAAEAAAPQAPAAEPTDKMAPNVGYTFAAMKNAANATVTLTGTVPDEASHAKLLTAARAAFAGQNVVDETKVQSGAPEGFMAVATTGLEQLSRLDHGELKIADTSMELSGGVLYANAIAQIQSALMVMPPGYNSAARLTTAPAAPEVDAAACQQLFADLLAKGKIQFETASAKIDKTSVGLLDHLVAVALRCPANAIEISGHTDASGSDATNMDLSKRRAQAVADYLATAGLDAKHLTSIGYGKTKPIAPNDTPDGMAKNRRIEFLVK